MSILTELTFMLSTGIVSDCYLKGKQLKWRYISLFHRFWKPSHACPNWKAKSYVIALFLVLMSFFPYLSYLSSLFPYALISSKYSVDYFIFNISNLELCLEIKSLGCNFKELNYKCLYFGSWSTRVGIIWPEPGNKKNCDKLT